MSLCVANTVLMQLTKVTGLMWAYRHTFLRASSNWLVLPKFHCAVHPGEQGTFNK